MPTDPLILEVLLHDEPIGRLTNIGGERSVFTFNDDYVADENRATLGLGFKDTHGSLITEFRPYKVQLMPFFSNLLPEGALREFLAQRAGVDEQREYHLLAALGLDLPGAVSVRHAENAATSGKVGSNSKEDSPAPEFEHSHRRMRFSLAGVQLKFSAAEAKGGGLTLPAQGDGGSWIVKLPSFDFDGVPENEFSMLHLAQLLGMNVPEHKLIDVSEIENLPERFAKLGRTAFAIRRFDRIKGGPSVHTEDFAQVFGVYPQNKYERARIRGIARVVHLEGSHEDTVELVRRLIFNNLIGNGDMHLKNWSLIYPDRRNASLAPAYDFVSTIPYLPEDQNALKVSRSSRFEDFSWEELGHFADKAGLPLKLVEDVARETVDLFMENWAREKRNLPLYPAVRDAIDRHLKRVPLLSSLN